MTEYSVDGSFDIHFGDTNSFEEISGKEEFQQYLAIDLHFRFRELIGNNRSVDNIAKKIRLATTRIAREYGEVESLAEVTVEEPTNTPNSLDVRIIYESGDVFEETI